MKKLFLLLSIAILAAIPLSAFAQDEEEWQEYTSEDGLLTVSYPAEWVYGEEEEFPGVLFASNEGALERAQGGDDTAVESGDFVVGLIFFPADLMAMLGVEVTEETTQADLTLALAATISGVETSTDPEATPDPEAGGPVVGEPIEIEDEDGETITIVPVTEESLNQAGFIIAWADEETGVVTVGVVSGFAEEFDEEATEVAFTILDSAEFTGTAEDLMAAMGM